MQTKQYSTSSQGTLLIKNISNINYRCIIGHTLLTVVNLKTRPYLFLFVLNTSVKSHHTETPNAYTS